MKVFCCFVTLISKSYNMTYSTPLLVSIGKTCHRNEVAWPFIPGMMSL